MLFVSLQYHAGDSGLTGECNEKEVGAHLAEALLSRIDPLADDLEVSDELLPQLEEPVVASVLLPDGRRLLRVTPPTAPGSIAFGRFSERGPVISTTVGDTSFVLRFDTNRTVNGVSCIAKDGSYSVRNLTCLYGIHETLLNSVVSRHAEGIVPDLFDFFRQPWAMALYHDRFKACV
jgi:hypothetical protein